MGSANLDELSQLAFEHDLVEAADKIKAALSTDQLIRSLENVKRLLVHLWQSPQRSLNSSLYPAMKAMISDELLHHGDLNVQVTMASCFSEIARISAPDPPYCDDVMREVFRIFMVAFRQLSSESGRNYLKALEVLKIVEKLNLAVMLLDIGPEERIAEMFQIFLNSIRSTHPRDVFNHMETIMTSVIKDSDGFSFEILRPLLHSVRKENMDASPSSWELGQKVFEECASELERPLGKAVRLKNLNVDDYAAIISFICQNKFNKASDSIAQPDAPGGDTSEESHGKEIAQFNEDGGALFSKKGRKPSQMEAPSSLKRKKMRSKTEAAGSSIRKDKKRRVPHEEDMGETMSQKHVTKVVSNQKGDASLSEPRTVEPKRKKNKTQKAKRSLVSYGEEIINAKIQVWWPLDERFYPGTVVEFDPVVKKHKILYDDNEKETLDLRAETWEFIDGRAHPNKEETDQIASSEKTVKTLENPVKKKKAPFKKDATSSSNRSTNEEGPQILGKPGESLNP